MKNSKIITVVFVVAIAILGLWQLPEINIEKADSSEGFVEAVESVVQQPEVQNQQVSYRVKVDSEVLADESSVQADSSSQEESAANMSNSISSVKKRYEEDWCDGYSELSEDDLFIAQTELVDWYKNIGRAYLKRDHNSTPDELSSYVDVYETLSIEQLKELALQRDKWAMVAFVQRRKGVTVKEYQLKTKVSEELLVLGASFHALSHLVLTAVVQAQISAKESDNEAAVEYIADALAYAYWGLENYDVSGINTFVNLIDREPFKTKFPLEDALARSVDKTNSKLAKLTSMINKRRDTDSIYIPEVPKVAEVILAKNVAFRQIVDKEKMELLRGLNIPTNNRIAITSCVEKYIEANTKHSS